ncbi:MAG: hypothetical protein MUC68_02970 [Burkholderiaceae bacterium]|jgi:hypothetical protein|nr:hypothetical protein [Burkholderiaceae bacterium]
MTGKELALALGISPQMVSKLKARGMPTDSVERATRWRRRHLEPGRMRGMRADRPRVQASAQDGEARERLDQLAQLGDLAAQDFPRWEARLRAALRAVSNPVREYVGLPLDVWEKLTEDGRRVLAAPEDAPAAWLASEQQWPEVSAFLYALAAGELELQGERLVAATPEAARLVLAIALLDSEAGE